MNKDDMPEQVALAYALVSYMNEMEGCGVDARAWLSSHLPNYQWQYLSPELTCNLAQNALNIALSTNEEFQRWETPLSPDPDEISILEETAEDLFQQLAALRKKIDELKGE